MTELWERLTEWFEGIVWWQRTLLIVAILFTGFLVADLLALPIYTRHGDEFQLPDVGQLHRDEAVRTLQDNGFIPVIQDSIYDNFHDPDVIIQQNPAPYSTVKKGRRVYLVVSSGEKPLFMPDLVTRTLTDAGFELKRVGLAVRDTVWRFSESIYHNGRNYKTYPGIVIRQSIEAGSNVRPDERVVLTVSLGPTKTLPNLTNEGSRTALKMLRNIGIARSKVTLRPKYEPRKLPNTVLSQSVRPGTPIENVDQLELIISVDKLPQSTESGGNGNNE